MTTYEQRRSYRVSFTSGALTREVTVKAHSAREARAYVRQVYGATGNVRQS